MSIRLRLVNVWHRVVTKTMFRMVRNPVLLRASFEAGRRFFRPPPGFWCEPAILTSHGHSVPALWAGSGKPRNDSVLIYIHGGGFIAGSASSYSKFAATLAGRLGGRALVPDYRLAPEHPFPSAREDVLACYRALLDAGTDPRRIVLAGDSAGGNLVLGLLAEIGRADMARPAASVVICPVADLTYSGDSFRFNARSEVVLPVQRAQDLNAAYLGDAPADAPEASPLFASFPGCPPVLIHVGSKEILLSDAERMAARLRSFGIIGVSIPIVAIWTKHRKDLLQMEIEATSTQTAERAAQYASRVQALEDRVQVLERIVTDRGYDVATQIEALRDQRRVEDTGSGMPIETNKGEKV